MSRKIYNTETPNKALRERQLIRFEPLTPNQTLTYRTWQKGGHLILSGSAGTGKTFAALYLALQTVLSKEQQTKVSIVRSIVPTREIGFLPGSIDEKLDAYRAPYINICSQLFNQKSAYGSLVDQGAVDFLSTSFIRGTTLDNQIILVDECQNLTFHELDSIITRAGINTRVILCGDYYQSDFTKLGDKNGINAFLSIFGLVKDVTHIEFTWDDIVRSDFVREYIMTKEMLRTKKAINGE